MLDAGLAHCLLEPCQHGWEPLAADGKPAAGSTQGRLCVGCHGDSRGMTARSFSASLLPGRPGWRQMEQLCGPSWMDAARWEHSEHRRRAGQTHPVSRSRHHPPRARSP